MNCLLDTSTFLWFVSDPARLSPLAVAIIEDSRNRAYLSHVSIWEIAIKFRTGKLDLIADSFAGWLDARLNSNSFRLLEIKLSHYRQYADLPLHHRDPFDGLLIAQSLAEELPLISSDRAFDQYAVDRHW